MSVVQRISYKTVSKAELGLSRSHMTHVGYATNFIDEWKKQISIKTKLTIFFDKDKSTSIISSFINDPIENDDGSLRSPKFRSGSDEEIPSLRDSIIYYYKLNMRDITGTPLLILFDLKKSGYKIEAFLISTGHKIFKKLSSELSYNLTHRNKTGEIYSKLITSNNNYSDDFKKLSNLYKDVFSNKEILSKVENDDTIQNNFNIDKIRDERTRTTTVRARIGQQNFRINVLGAYHNKCCVTGSDLIEALETNHIYDYRGADTNHIQNGIPLRADIHKLWTRGLLGITRKYKVVLHDKVKNSEHYKDYEGKKIKLPTNNSYYPNITALERHCKIHHLKWF